MAKVHSWGHATHIPPHQKRQIPPRAHQRGKMELRLLYAHCDVLASKNEFGKPTRRVPKDRQFGKFARLAIRSMSIQDACRHSYA